MNTLKEGGCKTIPINELRGVCKNVLMNTLEESECKKKPMNTLKEGGCKKIPMNALKEGIVQRNP